VNNPEDGAPQPWTPGRPLHDKLRSVSTLYVLANRVFRDSQVRLGLVDVDGYYARFGDDRDQIAKRVRERLAGLFEIAAAADVSIGFFAWPESAQPSGAGPTDRLVDIVLGACRALASLPRPAAGAAAGAAGAAGRQPLRLPPERLGQPARGASRSRSLRAKLVAPLAASVRRVMAAIGPSPRDTGWRGLAPSAAGRAPG
jgi:hypothetical protein